MNVLSVTCTPLDELMWIASVLGLEEGAKSLILDTETRMQLVNAMCICWLLTTVRSLILKLLHLWKVIACSIIDIMYKEHIHSKMQKIKQGLEIKKHLPSEHVYMAAEQITAS